MTLVRIDAVGGAMVRILVNMWCGRRSGWVFGQQEEMREKAKKTDRFQGKHVRITVVRVIHAITVLEEIDHEKSWPITPCTIPPPRL